MTTFQIALLILLAILAANATAGVLLLVRYCRESERRADRRRRAAEHFVEPCREVSL